jgi:flagellar protein FliS
MNPQAAQNYFRTKVLTATPEQLQLMLFDGAIRFGEQARAALLAKNFEQFFIQITRVQKIINQLKLSLRPDIDKSLCDKLSGLYTYAYKMSVEASVLHKVESLDEMLRIIKYQRETWAMLMEKLSKQKAGLAAQSIDMPSPDPRMEATFSMQG